MSRAAGGLDCAPSLSCEPSNAVQCSVMQSKARRGRVEPSRTGRRLVEQAERHNNATTTRGSSFISDRIGSRAMSALSRPAASCLGQLVDWGGYLLLFMFWLRLASGPSVENDFDAALLYRRLGATLLCPRNLFFSARLEPDWSPIGAQSLVHWTHGSMRRADWGSCLKI